MNILLVEGGEKIQFLNLISRNFPSFIQQSWNWWIDKILISANLKTIPTGTEMLKLEYFFPKTEKSIPRIFKKSKIWTQKFSWFTPNIYLPIIFHPSSFYFWYFHELFVSHSWKYQKYKIFLDESNQRIRKWSRFFGKYFLSWLILKYGDQKNFSNLSFKLKFS